MKKIIILLLLSVIFSNCSSDDTTEAPNHLLGKWYYKDTLIGFTIIPYNDHEACGRDYLEFLVSGEIRGIDVWDCEETIDFTGTYTQNNTELTIQSDTENTTVRIAELNANSLILSSTYDYDNDGDLEVVLERFER